MRYYAKQRQGNYGEAIGILLLDCLSPFIPGDVANATTYDFPVKYALVPGQTVSRSLAQDRTQYDTLLEAARFLKSQGVRAITSDCGFLAVYQKELLAELDMPIFLSSMMQVPFIASMIGAEKGIGVLTCSGECMTDQFLKSVDLDNRYRLYIEGLERHPNWTAQIIDEVGYIDSDELEKDIVESALSLQKNHPDTGAILFECSMLPPYAEAVHRATGLPVFDFITMINYVHQAVVPRTYQGHM